LRNSVGIFYSFLLANKNRNEIENRYRESYKSDLQIFNAILIQNRKAMHEWHKKINQK